MRFRIGRAARSYQTLPNMIVRRWLCSELQMLELRLCRELVSTWSSLTWIMIFEMVELLSRLCRSSSCEVASVLSNRILHWLELIKLCILVILFSSCLLLVKRRIVCFIWLLQICKERVHVAHHVVKFVVNLLEVLKMVKFTKTYCCRILTLGDGPSFKKQSSFAFAFAEWKPQACPRAVFVIVRHLLVFGLELKKAQQFPFAFFQWPDWGRALLRLIRWIALLRLSYRSWPRYSVVCCLRQSA